MKSWKARLGLLLIVLATLLAVSVPAMALDEEDFEVGECDLVSTGDDDFDGFVDEDALDDFDDDGDGFDGEDDLFFICDADFDGDDDGDDDDDDDDDDNNDDDNDGINDDDEEETETVIVG